MRAARELGRILRREGGYGEISLVLWILFGVVVALFVLPWLFNAANAAFGIVGALVVVVIVLVLLFRA